VRLAKKLKLENISGKLGIKKEYLDALETGELNKLPAGVYGKNFLKEYLLYLNINPEEALAVFDKEVAGQQTKSQEKLFVQKTPRAHYYFSLPKIIKNSIIIVAVLICITYLGFCIKNIVSPPVLNIYSPADNLTTSQNNIDIQGATDPEAEITINGEKILKNQDGTFIKNINLKSGLNTINITARKKYSRINYATKQILVKN
jgi:cytoskeletal protein RodZ